MMIKRLGFREISARPCVLSCLWVVSIVLICCGPSWSQESLTEQEKREVLLRLTELEILRKEVQLQKDFIAKEQEQDQREAELDTKAAALAEKQRQVLIDEVSRWKDQAEHYRISYEAVMKKGRGFGCVLKKIFTLGIGRCG